MKEAALHLVAVGADLQRDKLPTIGRYAGGATHGAICRAAAIVYRFGLSRNPVRPAFSMLGDTAEHDPPGGKRWWLMSVHDRQR